MWATNSRAMRAAPSAGPPCSSTTTNATRGAFGRSKTGEPGVIGPDGLGRAGLAGNRHAGQPGTGIGGSVGIGHGRAQSLANRGQRLGVQRGSAPPRPRITVPATPFFQASGSSSRPPLASAAIKRHDLQRRGPQRSLDRSPATAPSPAAWPRIASSVGMGKLPAASSGSSTPVGRPKPNRSPQRDEPIDAQAAGMMKEIDVATAGQSVGQRHLAVSDALLAKKQAAQAVGRVEKALAKKRLVGVADSFFQQRHGRERF